MAVSYERFLVEDAGDGGKEPIEDVSSPFRSRFFAVTGIKQLSRTHLVESLT